MSAPSVAAEEADDPEVPSPAVGPSKPRLLRVLGPGLITGASDDDPSGIATYGQAGAQFGYGLCWTMLYTLPLMAAVQMVSARIGRTTGHGIAGVLREHYPNGLLQAVVLLLLAANILNLGADLGAMADALNLLLPGPRWLYVVLFAGICAFMQLVLQYTRYVAVLKWLTLSLFAYLGVVIFARVSWWDLGLALAVPKLDFGGGGLTTLVALFGTTISPYLFFWQAAEEAEDLHAYPRRRDLLHAPEQGGAALHRIEVDTLVGMAFSNLVALATLVGMVISLGAVDPIRALYWSAVVNGVIAVPVMAVMMLAAARTDIMGAFAVRGSLRLLGWVATACMLLAVFAMLTTAALPLI